MNLNVRGTINELIIWDLVLNLRRIYLTIPIFLFHSINPHTNRWFSVLTISDILAFSFDLMSFERLNLNFFNILNVSIVICAIQLSDRIRPSNRNVETNLKQVNTFISHFDAVVVSPAIRKLEIRGALCIHSNVQKDRHTIIKKTEQIVGSSKIWSTPKITKLFIVQRFFDFSDEHYTDVSNNILQHLMVCVNFYF